MFGRFVFYMFWWGGVHLLVLLFTSQFNFIEFCEVQKPVSYTLFR